MLSLGKLQEISFNELKNIYPLEEADFRMEQFTFDSNKKEYHIVVSFLLENKNSSDSPLAKLSSSNFKFERVYKELTIDEQGVVQGFFIFNH
jgi:hypothetical protein